MAGSKSGLSKTFLVGARVSTHLEADINKCIFMNYTPANLRAGDGKKVNSRLEIPVMVNVFGREAGNSYRLVAWGKLADSFALNLNRGKEMHFECEDSPYMSDVRSRVDGSIILDKNGQPLQVRRTSYRIVDYSYGKDSFTTINEEIQFGIVTGEGKRPAQWNNPTHADNGIWKQMLLARKATYFSPLHQQNGYYGFAKVILPRTAGCQILYGPQYDKEPVYYQGMPAPAQTAAPIRQTVMMPNAPSTNTGGIVGQVTQVLNQAPKVPVMLNQVQATNQPTQMATAPTTQYQVPGNAPF